MNKKTITLEQASKLIENSAAVIVNGNALTYPVTPLESEDDNEWLFLSWQDEDSCLFYEIHCVEKNNQEPYIDLEKNELVLKEDTGEEFGLTLLDVKKLS